MKNSLSRRQFNIGSVATALAATTFQSTEAQPASSNERIRVGMIGVGNRGGSLLKGLLVHPDAQVVAICDVFQPSLDTTMQTLAKHRPNDKVDQYSDFRKLIERADLDAIVIATPDHWHAIQTIAACRAGKDVYVEKPLSMTIHEGRKMVEVAHEMKRVVQVGTHRRSSDVWKKATQMILAGDIGKATVSRAFRVSNMYPDGIGKLSPSDPPAGLDWDMWLGPRAARPYQDNIAPYKFRWWEQYSSQMGNWGVHYLDAMRWSIGEEAPTSICAMGGCFAVDDDRTIPDTAQVMFEFASGHLSIFGTYEASGNPGLPLGAEVELRGTKGTAYIGGPRIRVLPERGGQFQDPAQRMEPIDVSVEQTNQEQTEAHIRNFLDCIKSRETPAADIEIGHRSTSMAHLANISLAVKSRLEWDAEKEIVTNLPAANDLLHYEYRAPWTLD